MEISIEEIVFYILLIDSLGANAMAWGTKGKWYRRNFRIFSRNFPLSKGWTSYYLLIVLWIGFMLYRAGVWV